MAGINLRRAREAQVPHLSQYKLADRIGISRSRIASYEGGVAEPPAEVIEKVSDLLDIPPSWFWSAVELPVPKRDDAHGRPVKVLTEAERSKVDSLIRSHTYVEVALWKGALCGAGDEVIFEEGDPEETTEVASFYTSGKPGRHAIAIAHGLSMEPRIEHGSKVLIKKDENVPVGYIVAAQNPDNNIYLKHLMRGSSGLILRSLNPTFPDITDLEGWVIRGGAVMIQHPYDGGPNLEWDEGRYLRAIVGNRDQK